MANNDRIRKDLVMSHKKVVVVGLVVATLALGYMSAVAAPPPATVVLSAAGQKLEAQYTERLKTLQKELATVVPVLTTQHLVLVKSVVQENSEAVKKAKADLKQAEAPFDELGKAQGAVGHATWKWIGGAQKNIAKAQEDLQKATNEVARAAAQKALADALVNLQDGSNALAIAQARIDKVKAEEAKFTKAREDAKAALAKAKADDLKAAQAALKAQEACLSSDRLDANLVTCAVLANATTKGLATFAQQGKEQADLVERLLGDTALMKAMLEAGGPRDSKYGEAMQIYSAIRKASDKAKNGIFNRLALAVALEHAVPISQRNAVTETNSAPALIDPVKRYLHYEKAYLDGELDPAFPRMTAWECRQIVNSDAPDHILAWGREMLRNVRPDHLLDPDYGWRYSRLVRTDVSYVHSYDYTDTDSLQFYQNIIKNGGICGRRAWFGTFILQCFGIPSTGRAQTGHAALTHWTPDGWVVNLGGGFGCHNGKPVLGMTDEDFVLETQSRNYPEEYVKVLRAQWIGDALGEPKYISTKAGSGGVWNNIAMMEKRAIVAEAKPKQLAALGTELGEANESAAAKARAVVTAAVTEADKQVVVAADGTITIPAGAFSSGGDLLKSFLGGQQMLCGGTNIQCEVTVSQPGKYKLSARVVTVHREGQVPVTVNEAKEPVGIFIPFTIGLWQRTAPVEVTLVNGKNTLRFDKPTTCFSLHDITLTPVK